ncbi:Uncharacterised protein [Vibrio cholerae]|nr:Uncharacterised protein [Vibrio cholerae]
MLGHRAHFIHRMRQLSRASNDLFDHQAQVILHFAAGICQFT